MIDWDDRREKLIWMNPWQKVQEKYVDKIISQEKAMIKQFADEVIKDVFKHNLSECEFCKSHAEPINKLLSDIGIE